MSYKVNEFDRASNRPSRSVSPTRRAEMSDEWVFSCVDVLNGDMLGQIGDMLS